MTEPIFTEAAEEFYRDFVPEHYRVMDSRLDWPLKRWLSGYGDQLENLRVLYERFNYQAPDDGGGLNDTSDLVDPMTANPEWLNWRAQLTGHRIVVPMAVDEKRAFIADTRAGLQPGTIRSMLAAARTALSGERYCNVYRNTSNAASIGTSDMWHMMLVTKASEEVRDPRQAIIDAGVKPAGVILHHNEFTTTWNVIMTKFPTWAAWNAASWKDIEEAGRS